MSGCCWMRWARPTAKPWPPHLLHRLPQAPPALTELLIKQSAGNPYYMEELLKMLIDDGVVAIEGPAWTVHAERLAAARVPSTLTGVLQARLDALAVAERHALQQASIVGSVFWDDALAALDPLAPSALPALQGKALVQRREGSAFEDTAEEAFRHHLLHQVAYETVLKAERRAGHAAAARWLAARVNDRSGEHLATTAQHFLQAGDSAQAARWLADAAEHAALRFDNRTALAHAQQALQHAPRRGPALALARSAMRLQGGRLTGRPRSSGPDG
jgi:predicted ATPase